MTGTAAHVLRAPFVYAAAVLVIVTIGVFRLPETFVDVLKRNALLQDASAGWALRLLALVAGTQALYAGWVVFRPERVAASAAQDSVAPGGMARTMSWTAAAIAALTLLYGLAAFLTTGERGGFWLFVVIAVAQLAWYFRLTANAIDRLRLQPRRDTKASEPTDRGAYCPPLARGVSVQDSAHGNA